MADTRLQAVATAETCRLSSPARKAPRRSLRQSVSTDARLLAYAFDKAHRPSHLQRVAGTSAVWCSMNTVIDKGV